MDPNLRALSQVPRHPWDADPATWYFDLLTDRVFSALPSLAAMSLPPWSDLLQGIKQFYGDLESPRHALNLEPLDWGERLQEPQITKTLCTYLDPQVGAEGVSRCALFLKTLFELSGISWLETSTLTAAELQVVAEQRIAGRKKSQSLDLLIEIAQNGVTRAVVMKFKFEQHASKGQLNNIAKWTHKQYEDCLLFLVVPNPDKQGHIRSEHPNWHMLSWQTLLRRLELNMLPSPADIDHQQYRLFRRTMLQLAIGI